MSLRVFHRLKFKPRSLYMLSTSSTSTVQSKKSIPNSNKVSSWQIHSYGGLEELQFEQVKPHIIRNPNSVVVQVLASSVNPLDIAMVGGYGSVLLNFMRQAEKCSLQKQIEFPLTLGRDFAGTVIQKGYSVRDKFEIGDEVWGVIPPQDQGSHTEQVLVSKNFIHKRPKNISVVEAGSMLYAAVTAWSALKITGDIGILGGKGKTVLVLGGSGGVGTMAVQLLKNWGAHVVTTCSADAIPLLESLGITDIIDYHAEDALDKIASRKYDVIFDCAGIGQENGAKLCNYLKEYRLSKFITLKSPMLKNVDEYGLLGGMIKNAGDLLYTNVSTGVLPKSSSVRWGFFMPCEQALSEITTYVENGKLLPCVQKVYSFQDLPKAYKHASEGHLRGKIVIDMSLEGT